MRSEVIATGSGPAAFTEAVKAVTPRAADPLSSVRRFRCLGIVTLLSPLRGAKRRSNPGASKCGAPGLLPPSPQEGYGGQVASLAMTPTHETASGIAPSALRSAAPRPPRLLSSA